MLQEQQLIADAAGRALGDEALLDGVCLRVGDPAEPAGVQWRHHACAGSSGQVRIRIDDGGGLHATHDSRGPRSGPFPGPGRIGRKYRSALPSRGDARFPPSWYVTWA